MDLDYDALFMVIDEWTAKMAERAARLTREKAWGDSPDSWIATIKTRALDEADKDDLRRLIADEKFSGFLRVHIGREKMLGNYDQIKRTYKHPDEYITYSFLSAHAGVLRALRENPRYTEEAMSGPMGQLINYYETVFIVDSHLNPSLQAMLSVFMFGRQAYQRVKEAEKMAALIRRGDR